MVMFFFQSLAFEYIEIYPKFIRDAFVQKLKFLKASTENFFLKRNYCDLNKNLKTIERADIQYPGFI